MNARAIKDALLELFFPRAAQCLVCGDPRRAEVSDCLCPDCREKLDALRLRGALCPRCMTPFGRDGGCAFCRKGELGALSDAYAAFHYAGAARQLILQLKFSWQDEPAAALGRAMAEVTPIGCYDALVPVPLFPARERYRGANQALLLSQEVSGRVHLPVVEALRRARDTRAQSGLSGSKRRGNVKNAFVPVGDVRGARFLLVDDVRTTGATLRACAQALTDAGAQRVGALTAAAAFKGDKARK